MVKYELELTKIIKSVKYTNQTIKLYTDDIGYEYYKKEMY